ncbi:hypothetical protein [Piscirickettsia litoralis]|uniref:hypothetical protein n=1 Tax=Piscirickettsia litoralis TaxID=1891921 RepID=UPI001112EA3E|nr:hypothetical protein [Piscirickettsia litoralis]
MRSSNQERPPAQHEYVVLTLEEHTELLHYALRTPELFYKIINDFASYRYCYKNEVYFFYPLTYFSKKFQKYK